MVFTFLLLYLADPAAVRGRDSGDRSMDEPANPISGVNDNIYGSIALAYVNLDHPGDTLYITPTECTRPAR